ncbi:MAG: tripartite tricarboxylate transporter substrate binding protein [Burkholderiales bacterium]|nr:tripartite tricarboxylate transporter substrate binding protein [Burkholderiales bacterium]
MTGKTGAVLALALAAGIAPVEAALAQAYPARPVRVIVPFPPGGVNDSSARAFAQVLTATWSQAIVIENRAGANGNIGMEACAKAAPDGYTLCYPSGLILTLNPVAYSKMPFEVNELAPVIQVGTLDQALAVNAALPARTVQELIDLARAGPNTISFASLGMGSTAHLYAEWLRARYGAQFIHVPYKGSPQLLQAVAGGEAMVSANTPAVVLPSVKAGGLRVIAVVAEARKRSPLLPEVPTMQEQGFDLNFRNWLAMFFPKGTPAAFARRWNAAINRMLADPKFVERHITALAVTPAGGTPRDLFNFLKANQKVAAELARIANLRFD